MDKFFADTEEEQQRQFIEKYTTTFISPAFLYTCHKLLDCFICDIPSISTIAFTLADIRCGLSCRYNYDPVNDKPLPGHFKWQKVDP